MKLRLKTYLRDPWILVPALVGGGFIGATGVMIALAHPTNAAGAFLHTSVVAGVNLTGSWKILYSIPAVAVVFWLSDLIGSWYMHPALRPLARILTILAALVCIGAWWGVRLLIAFNA
jgi:uncharacterized membrane protein